MSSSSLPPYPGTDPSQECYWKIRNTKYRSGFATYNEPSLSHYREHLECIKESLLANTSGIGSLSDSDPHVVEVQHSQAFTNIEFLISEYQARLRQIKPLEEEDVLFLLLKRFAECSGAAVYTEIRRPGEVQIFDSTIREPLHTNSIADHLAYGSGVINSEIPINPACDATPLETPPLETRCGLHATSSARTPPLETKCGLNSDYYEPLPQTTPIEVSCSVTVNFPELFADTREPPAYRENLGSLTLDQPDIPEKLQPPNFRVHRCHHRGVEQGAEGDGFEMPLGLPEVVHHMYEAPHNFYHAGFYISNKTLQSLPQGQGNMIAFECVIEEEMHVYITVERDGTDLAYNCFRDKEVWETSHRYHEECNGCPDV